MKKRKPILTEPLRIKCSAFSINRDPELRKLVTEVFPEAIFGTTDEKISPENFHAFAADAHALIIGRERIDKSVLEAAPCLRVIAKYGVGLDNIDFEACRSAGVEVLYARGVNRQCVAELTLGFMLGALHNMFVSDRLLHQNIWLKDGGRDLQGKTVGIIGFGHIGTRLADLLQPFDVTILVNDIVDKSEECRKYHATRQTHLEELLHNSDIVTLHVPLDASTRNMIARPQLELMKPHAVLINAARGGIVNERDLLEHLEKGGLAAACLDVFETEPATGNALLKHPRVVATPHIGGNSAEARRAMTLAAVQLLRNFLKKKGYWAEQ